MYFFRSFDFGWLGWQSENAQNVVCLKTKTGHRTVD